MRGKKEVRTNLKWISVVAIIFVVIVTSCWCYYRWNKKVDEVSMTKNAATKTKGETKKVKPVTAEPVSPQESIPQKNILIAIDPGHQGPAVDMSDQEENAPGSGVQKQKATGGTTGAFTGVAEYQLNLDIALKLKEQLQQQGYQVLMTRENNETAISNKERAELANAASADISIRIHANGSENEESEGALCLIPSPNNPYVGQVYEQSNRLAENILQSYCAATGFSNQGVQQNDTMTGINWSTIPVVILEMGFMTNEFNDVSMQEPAMQEKMVTAIVEGVQAYYGMSGTTEQIQQKVADIQAGLPVDETWAVYTSGLTTGSVGSVGNKTMKAASLIKLFVAGTVEEQKESLKSTESYEGEVESLMGKMLLASDNDATNVLIKKLGNTDARAGMNVVNEFCKSKGYKETQLGRLMLDFNAQDENYTSVNDCGRFLTDLYHGQLIGSEAILEHLKKQERTGKIPSGLPSGVLVANKTGELDDVEHDVAIVWGTKEPYVLCVMSGELKDVARARGEIQSVSTKVYELLND